MLPFITIPRVNMSQTRFIFSSLSILSFNCLPSKAASYNAFSTSLLICGRLNRNISGNTHPLPPTINKLWTLVFQNSICAIKKNTNTPKLAFGISGSKYCSVRIKSMPPQGPWLGLECPPNL